MRSLPFQVSCPNGCVTHSMSSGPDHHYTLAVVFGKNPDTRKSEIMVLKCRKCRFEAWASKELRDKLGKPNQPYWSSESNSIISKEGGVETK